MTGKIKQSGRLGLAGLIVLIVMCMPCIAAAQVAEAPTGDASKRDEYNATLATRQEDANTKVNTATATCLSSPGSQACTSAQTAARDALLLVAQQANVIADNEAGLALKDSDDTHTDVINAQTAANAASQANDTCVRNFGAANCSAVSAESNSAIESASQAQAKETQQANDALADLQQILSDDYQSLPDGPEKEAVEGLVNQVNGLTFDSSVEDLQAANDAINNLDCSRLGTFECYDLKSYLSGVLSVLLDQQAKECATSGDTDCVATVKDMCDNLMQGNLSCGLGSGTDNNTNFDSLAAVASQNKPFICTTDKNFTIDPGEQSIVEGILTSLAGNVINIMDDAVETFYNKIAQDNAFINIVGSLMVLYVIFYAVAFLFGIAGLTLEEGLVRLVKMAIIIALFSPGGWDFFYGTVGKFFINGANEVMNQLSLTASQLFTGPTGNPDAIAGSTVGVDDTPLRVLEGSLRQIFSVKMGVAIMALVFSGYFGLIHAVLLVIGIFIYLRFMLNVIWIFLMSIVVKGLLFALSPLFITFMLFKRTTYLFEGWVTQLVSYTLQPIFLFLFLGFFSVFVTAALNSVMNVELCWVPVTLGDIQGSFWRFMGGTGGVSLDQNTWNQISGDIANDDFPIKIVDILIFTMVSYLAWGASKVAVQIAESLADGIKLSDSRGALSNYFGGMVDSGKTWAAGKVMGSFK